MRPMVKEVAEAMEAKRRELINQPLARIWPELAQVAVDVQRKWIENSLFGPEDPETDEIANSYNVGE